MKPHILLIDNYDSFAHNLARYAELAGAKVTIKRNDALTITKIKRLKPSGIIISPGPCAPTQAGISTDIVTHFGATTPILGVCLGHQCIAEAYGGMTAQSPAPSHGQPAKIIHEGGELFDGIPSPFEAGRYHSLISDLSTAPDLITTARLSGDGTIMAFAHPSHPVYGVQFHPESILTPHGQQLIDNFIKIVIDWHT